MILIDFIFFNVFNVIEKRNIAYKMPPLFGGPIYVSIIISIALIPIEILYFRTLPKDAFLFQYAGVFGIIQFILMYFIFYFYLVAGDRYLKIFLRFKETKYSSLGFSLLFLIGLYVIIAGGVVLFMALHDHKIVF